VRAALLGDLGRQLEALTACDEAVRLAPSAGDGYYARSFPLHALHLRTDAVIAARKAVELAPGEPTFALRLGELLVRHEPEEAEGLLRQYLASHESNADVLRALADALLERNQLLEAARAITAAVSLDPSNVATRRFAYSVIRRLLHGRLEVGYAAYVIAVVVLGLVAPKWRLPALIAIVSAEWLARRAHVHRRRRALANEDPQIMELYDRLLRDREVRPRWHLF
jgi:tetratricopeptide (TPR) repeat protein